MKGAQKLFRTWVCLSVLVAFNVAGIHVAMAADEKKKPRRVPAISQSLYKQMSEAQIMIDPDSMPREEGEPAPVPKGTPQDGINKLLEIFGSMYMCWMMVFVRHIYADIQRPHVF